MWYWTWRGKCFGYRQNDDLRTHDGKHIGRFVGDEVYGADGSYLGEVMNKTYLITNKSKKNSHKSSRFLPWAKETGFVKYTDYTGFVMYTGYEDFPPPESF